MATERTRHGNAGKKGAGAVLVGASVATVLWLSGALSTQTESVRLVAYADPLHGWNVPTICMGETGRHVVRGMTSTLEECYARMEPRHRKLLQQSLACMAGEVTLPQVLSVMDLADNVGMRPVCNSTMLTQQRAGEPPETWCRQFTEARARFTPWPLPITDANKVIEPIGWVVGAGRSCRDARSDCRGLVTRRENAQRLCLGDLSVIKAWAP